ncbi:hypothetical protein LAZ67_5000312 [Cordylochernes scorpioides]|uniref:E3 ubiquitin-protein ligase MARCHF5 n=1 Tax=Cordylochernes scorpioides TaxID=51811 RepID=A0ABY6KJK9_9ARAC|nr:hypothetical protein LAZ67_5000312 [Cordylochernes scorpioides]
MFSAGHQCKAVCCCSQKQCWVCFAAEEDDLQAEWVQPCQCRGTTKWVHQGCLQRWVDEKQRGNMATKVACPQCNTEYLLIFPPLGAVAYILDVTDRMFYKVCPYLAAGLFLGSVYWTAVTYGAVTVMQVLGHKEGLGAMEQTDPLFLLVGLPTIPVMLILGKMLRWEEYVLRLFCRYSARIPLLKYLLSSEQSDTERIERVETHNVLSDPISATRTLCGALVLPTLATLVGRVCFSSVSSNLHRAALGGLTFVAIKGLFKIYLRKKQFHRQRERRILNYSEHPTTVVTTTLQ